MARLSKAREAVLLVQLENSERAIRSGYGPSFSLVELQMLRAMRDAHAELTAVREERDALMAAARHIGRAPSQATLQIVRDTVAKIEAAEKERDAT